MSCFDASCDVGAQQDAEDGKDGHDGEDNLVAVDALMAIEDGAVDGVHEGAGQIADEGGHGHGGTCDFAGDVDFIHGGEEDGAHAVDAGADGQGDDDAGPDAEGLIGHPGEGDEDDGCNQITDAQVFGRRMEELVRQDAADGASDHF